MTDAEMIDCPEKGKQLERLLPPGSPNAPTGTTLAPGPGSVPPMPRP